MDIYELLKKYEKYTAFTYGKCNDEDIDRIEALLNVKLPEDYIRYIKTFGGGGISGIEILGIGASGRLIVVDETQYYREKYDLPEKLIVIKSSDEWVYCIDSDNFKILTWYYDGSWRYDYNSFEDFLIEITNDVIENMIYSGEIQEDE